MRRPETYAASILTWWYFAAELVKEIEDETDFVHRRCVAGRGGLQHSDALAIRVQSKIIVGEDLAKAGELARRPEPRLVRVERVSGRSVGSDHKFVVLRDIKKLLADV